MKGGLRRVLGGNKDSTAAGLFALHSPNLVGATVHEPGQGRFVMVRRRAPSEPLEPAGAPLAGQADRPRGDRFYQELATFVLGSAAEAELWRLWHAWMLQNPGKAPGWGWIIKSGQGLGKDLLTFADRRRARARLHAGQLSRAFGLATTAYAEKHLIIASEMRSRKGQWRRGRSTRRSRS